MDMHVFQVESNKVLPQQGSILISSPFMNDYHFTRAVVLLIEHNDEGSMGIIMNKDFRYHILLNDLIPELEFAQRVPVYKGGPGDNIFPAYAKRSGRRTASGKRALSEW